MVIETIYFYREAIMPDKKGITCLGWGSLIWDPYVLREVWEETIRNHLPEADRIPRIRNPGTSINASFISV